MTDMTMPQAAVLSMVVAALFLLVLGVTLFVKGLPGWLPRRKPTPVSVVDEDTVPLPVLAPRTGEPCPSCGRNAGHNEDCTRVQLRRAAKAIDIPREGEASR